ncbi:MAG: hypothetical protein CVT64_00495 [Actinobacteria bacterium HGW-Actinobacteria-4]|nr:MAG: hypothetical protein CVT64_00495 [Actinobacteria bacterium HGW-Actinobacteria-4]
MRYGRRAQAWGGAGIVAGAVTLSVVVWAALPGGPAVVGPSSIDDVAKSWTIEIDGAGDAPVVDAPFLLDAGRGPQCGDPWTLEPGVTVHDADWAEDVKATFAVRAWVTTDSDQVLPPRRVWAGFEGLVWEVDGSSVQAAPPYGWSLVPALVVDGHVAAVGFTDGGYGGGAGDTWTMQSRYGSPLPGQCGNEELPTDVEGEYQAVLIAQAVGASIIEPILTVVIPLEPLLVDYTGVASWWGLEVPVKDPATPDPAPEGAAELRAPEGDVYQAFVVPTPNIDSCTPLADQRAALHPSAETVSYDVTIPGLQPITSEWWGADPVAIVEDDSFRAWYLGLNAWLLADYVSAGDPSPSVGWTRGSNWQEPDTGDVGLWRLLGRAGAGSPPGTSDDCDYVQPIPAISGAVWLIIEGADWETIERENPGEPWATPDVMTWVYLGDA